MRKATVCVHGIEAGVLSEVVPNKKYVFEYHEQYSGPPVSLTMSLEKKKFLFNSFPPFFEGLLPEGIQLEALLRQKKLDRSDYFGQLLAVGKDMVGAVTVEETIS